MKDDEKKRLEDLWTRFVAGEQLATPERSALVAAAARDELFRRRMLHDLQIDGALRAVGQIEREEETFAAKMRALLMAASRTDEVVAVLRTRIERRAHERRKALTSPPPRRQRYAIAAGVAAAAAALLVAVWPRQGSSPAPADPIAETTPQAPAPRSVRTPDRRASEPTRQPTALAEPREPLARMEILEGRGYVHGSDGSVRAGLDLKVRSGDWLSTAGPSARARLSHFAGGRVELEGDTAAGLTNTVEGARVFLAHGRGVAVLPAGQIGSALVLASPHATITGPGTVRLQVSATSTRIDVTDGRARVAALGVQRGIDVETGQFALVRADDIEPPTARVALREALLLIGPDDTQEDRPPAPGMRGSEERMKNRLEQLGFSVKVVEASALLHDDARNATLLVLSSSVAVTMLPPSFADLPVPMLMLESTALGQFGLTGSRWRQDLGPAGSRAEVAITRPGHPLAAGLSGPVRLLTTPVNLRWAVPPPSADGITTVSTGPEEATLIFGYERGAAMATGVATARRVGFLLGGNGRIIRALSEQGWQLFDAAVAWATAAP